MLPLLPCRSSLAPPPLPLLLCLSSLVAACTAIDNCADVRSSDATDQRCEDCQSNHGLGFGEAAYRNLGNACEPLCSWLDAYCYPGNCSGHISTCECVEGFTGPDCLERKSHDGHVTGLSSLVLIPICSDNSSTVLSVHRPVVPGWGISGRGLYQRDHTHQVYQLCPRST